MQNSVRLVYSIAETQAANTPQPSATPITPNAKARRLAHTHDFSLVMNGVCAAFSLMLIAHFRNAAVGSRLNRVWSASDSRYGSIPSLTYYLNVWQ
jgi:hypothetical protein